jgi:uncharacterized membrane protein YadS
LDACRPPPVAALPEHLLPQSASCARGRFHRGRAILFALPSIFLLPWPAGVWGLSDAVAGAWIGGNIDTTAAVTAAGTLAGEDALKIATIVKVTQNALIGVVAVALTAYFAFKVEKTPARNGPA